MYSRSRANVVFLANTQAAVHIDLTRLTPRTGGYLTWITETCICARHTHLTSNVVALHRRTVYQYVRSEKL